jgi:tetratricopeptide (TPR) repeat protein
MPLVADDAWAQQPADVVPVLEPPGSVLPPAADALTAAGAPAAAVAPTPTSVAPATASATDAYTGFRAQFDAGRYSEAVPYATRVLELAEQQAAQPAAEEVQVALMNLGLVQNLSGDYVGAETTFLRVIELIAASGRPLYTRLARAYGGLASAYHDGQRHDLAVKSFDQAIALVRRHVGLLTEQQVPLIEKYIDSLTELGRYEDALKAQKYVLRIATRAHGERGVGIVPTLEQIGRWYASIGAYDQSRRTLKQAIDIVEDAESEKSPRLVGPLLALAACNRRQMLDPAQQPLATPDAERTNIFQEPGAIGPTGYSLAMMATEGEESLLRAAAIIDGQTESSPAQVVNVRTQVGDWYQLRAQNQRALPHYQQAWQAAARITDRIDGKSYTEALFGQPVLLHMNRPENWNRYRARAASEVEIRNVVVEFTVNDKGRVESPRVVDDSGDPKRGERTAAALVNTARYRPRFDNGQPVAAAGVNFSQPWILLLPPPATVPQGETTAPASPTESPAPTTGTARPESAT